MTPIEPWAGSLRLLMIVFGALLVLTFVAPWTTDPVKFSWQLITDAPKVGAKLVPIAIVVAGLLALVLGAAPASVTARGIGATAAGFLVFALFGFALVGNAGGDVVGWRGYAVLVTMLAGPAGLLLRAKYPHSMAARVLGTVAGVAMLAVFLVPIDGKIPITQMKILTDQPGAAKVMGYGLYVVLAAGAACLLVWMPPSATPMATLLAWANIVLIPLVIATMIIVGLSGGNVEAKVITRAPSATLFPAIWFAAASALFGYGVATLVGKTHEHQAT